MNPILSDLDIRISAIEAEAGLAARQRLHLAKAAAGPRARLGSALLNAVRQFIDPRGYALAVIGSREGPRQARPIAPVRGNVVKALPSRQPGQDAELPAAA